MNKLKINNSCERKVELFSLDAIKFDNSIGSTNLMKIILYLLGIFLKTIVIFFIKILPDI